jgi:hypothetical protein
MDEGHQPVWHDHLLEVKRKFWHKCPIMLLTEVPGQYLLEFSVRLEVVQEVK